MDDISCPSFLADLQTTPAILQVGADRRGHQIKISKQEADIIAAGCNITNYVTFTGVTVDTAIIMADPYGHTVCLPTANL